LEILEDFKIKYNKLPKFGKNKTIINNITKLMKKMNIFSEFWLEIIGKNIILKKISKDKTFKGKIEYNQKEIDYIVDFFCGGISNDINELVNNPMISLSKNQLKKIRYICKEGTEFEIKLLKKSIYTISSIEKISKIRKKIKKEKNNIVIKYRKSKNNNWILL